MRYANAANRRRGQQGHLWQGRFYSCVLGGKHLAAAIRYVERNPVRARIVRYAENCRWSSAAFHVEGRDDGVTDATGRFGDVTEGIRGGWKAWLRLGDEADYCDALRSCTRTGRPFGTAAFIKRPESKSGRRLHALGRGRPRKKGK
jgi:putative transposase